MVLPMIQMKIMGGPKYKSGDLIKTLSRSDKIRSHIM